MRAWSNTSNRRAKNDRSPHRCRHRRRYHGRGIAHAAALGGYRTILEDLLPNALRKAETEIRANSIKPWNSAKSTPRSQRRFRAHRIRRLG